MRVCCTSLTNLSPLSQDASQLLPMELQYQDAFSLGDQYTGAMDSTDDSLSIIFTVTWWLGFISKGLDTHLLDDQLWYIGYVPHFSLPL
ncbi:hypothetical protein P3S68_002213 [Capsicum galapagoense]